MAAAPAVPAPAAGERVERVDPADPEARQVAEAALRSAERQSALHQAADVARDAHGAAWARLYADPLGAQVERARVARTLGAEVSADVFRRTPEAFGRLTAEGAAAVARGQARELTAAIEGTGARWQAAERERPRMPAAQVSAELQRAQLGMGPFQAFDRAREVKAIAERELKRSLGLDRGGRGR